MLDKLAVKGEAMQMKRRMLDKIPWLSQYVMSSPRAYYIVQSRHAERRSEVGIS